jgi:PilZ domain-containing protein
VKLLHRERRRCPRFADALEIELTVVPTLESRQRRTPPLHGRVRNVSNAGMCLVTEQPLEASSLLRCGVPLPGAPVAVPTLMQVRWTRQNGSRFGSYISGLQFIL